MADQPLKLVNNVKAYSHLLVESVFTFFAKEGLLKSTKADFPQVLSELPWLMQSKSSAVRTRLSSWLEKNNISPNIVAEFDDSALMKSFGQAGFGLFGSPTLIEDYIIDKYDVTVIGRDKEIIEQYYIISPERRLKHPAIIEIVSSANQYSL